MMKDAKQKRGRPIQSRNVRITPEFRERPDIEKLGRALIAIAKQIAEKKKAGVAGNEDGAGSVGGEGDAVT